MKNIKYLLLIIMALFAINVYADDTCDSNELARVKELAKKVEFDYSYVVNDDATINFSIEAVNLNRDLEVVIVEDYYNQKYREFKDNASHSNKLDGFRSGERVVITINAYVPNRCSGKTVLTKTIKLPYYNLFYDKKACEGYEEFKYCKELIDSNITEQSFYNQLNQYKREKNKTTPVAEKTGNNNNNLILILGLSAIASIIITVVVLNVMKIRKKNRL